PASRDVPACERALTGKDRADDDMPVVSLPVGGGHVDGDPVADGGPERREVGVVPDAAGDDRDALARGRRDDVVRALLFDDARGDEGGRTERGNDGLEPGLDGRRPTEGLERGQGGDSGRARARDDATRVRSGRSASARTRRASSEER